MPRVDLILRLTGALLPAVLLAAGASAAVRAAAPTGAGDVGVFARYSGTWKLDVTHNDTPYSKPGKESMVMKNDCWRSDIFYVCNQIIDGTSKALLVFFYNVPEKTYGSFPLAVGSSNARAGDVNVDGNTITFPWQIADNGKTVYMRIVNTFTTPDTMDFRHEYSEDGKKWVAIATGVEHRVVEAKGSTKSK